MKNRCLFLVLILFLRFILGWVEALKYSQNNQIIISGNIYNIYRNTSKCIIEIGRFWINYRDDCQFSQKDKIKVIGNIKKGVTDVFLGRLWLDSAKIEVLSNEALSTTEDEANKAFFDTIRENTVNVYAQHLPDPELGLVAGIILGYKKDIGYEFYDQMVKSGTIHIAVASGYNIMLVGGTVLSLCLWIMKRSKASVAAMTGMVLYAAEAGGEPPVVRAVIMGAVVFIGAAIGRKTITWWILLVSGWLMVLWDPLLLVNISFQLTMAASLGLMVVEPKMTEYIENKSTKMAEFLSGSGILSSLSTMATTMPFIWWHFGRVNWIGILSNILILPLVPILMIFGVGMQILPSLFSWPVYAMAHWMVGVIRFFGS